MKVTEQFLVFTGSHWKMVYRLENNALCTDIEVGWPTFILEERFNKWRDNTLKKIERITKAKTK